MTGFKRFRLGAGRTVVVTFLGLGGCAVGGSYLSVSEGGVLPQAPDRSQVAVFSCDQNLRVLAVEGAELAKMTPPQEGSWCGPGKYLVLKPGRSEVRVLAPRAREEGVIQRSTANVTFAAVAGKSYTMELTMTVLSVMVSMSGEAQAGDAVFGLVVKEAGTDEEVDANVRWAGEE